MAEVEVWGGGVGAVLDAEFSPGGEFGGQFILGDDLDGAAPNY
jgi:hypothetical protein